MSAVGKLDRRGMFHAFSAGMYFAQREAWMQRARTEKQTGAKTEVLRQCVKYARGRNHELVRQLRTIAAGIPFLDYDRERQISATGAFGRVRYNAPAGSLEP